MKYRKYIENVVSLSEVGRRSGGRERHARLGKARATRRAPPKPNKAAFFHIFIFFYKKHKTEVEAAVMKK